MLLMLREVERLEDPSPWISDLKEQWLLSSTESFGFPPAFDRYLTTGERLRFFLPLAEAALTGIFEEKTPDLQLPKCDRWGYLHPIALNDILAKISSMTWPKTLLLETARLTLTVLREEMMWKVSDPEAVNWIRSLPQEPSG